MNLSRRAFLTGTPKAIAAASLVVGVPGLVQAALLLPVETPPLTPLKIFWPIGALSRLDRNEQVVIGERYLRAVPMGYDELERLMFHSASPHFNPPLPTMDWRVRDIERHALQTLVEAAREYEADPKAWEARFSPRYYGVSLDEERAFASQFRRVQGTVYK